MAASSAPNAALRGRSADKLLSLRSPQLEDEEGVTVELLAQEEVDCRYVLARIRPVGA